MSVDASAARAGRDPAAPDKKCSGPKNFRVFQRGLFCAGLIVVLHATAGYARQAGRKRDESIVVLTKKVHIHTRAVVEAVYEAARDHIAEVR